MTAVLDALAKLCSDTEGKVRVSLEKINSAELGLRNYKSYSELGTTPEARAEKDTTMLQLQGLESLSVELTTHCAGSDPKLVPKSMSNLRTSLDSIIATDRPVRMTNAKKAGQALLDSKIKKDWAFTDVVGGGRDGKEWYDSQSVSKLPEIWKLWETTGRKISPNKIETGLKDLQDQLDIVVNLQAKLGETPEVKEWVESTTAKIERGWQTCLDGKLLGMMIQKDDTAKGELKSEIIDELKKPKWGNVPLKGPVSGLVDLVKKSRGLGTRPGKPAAKAETEEVAES
jgi:hypothetical protein